MAEDSQRVNYFKYQFLNAEDFLTEQAYHRRTRALATLNHFGHGIVRGLEVKPGDRTSVKVSPGYAVDPSGQGLHVDGERTVSLTGLAAGSTGVVFVAFDEHEEGPTRVGDETRYTRWREEPTVDVAAQLGPGQVALGAVTRQANADPVLDPSLRTMLGPHLQNAGVRAEHVHPGVIGAEHVRAASIRHSQLVLDGGTNPHRTTATDVGALPLAGGTISGRLTAATSGSAGWVQALVGQVGVSGDAAAAGVTGIAHGEGGGQKVGLEAHAVGALGWKYAVRAQAQTTGDGPASGGSFTAGGDGKGQKMGLTVFASGALGTKYGLQVNAEAPGDDAAYGGMVYAQGDGKGQKTGLSVSAGGALGTKIGVELSAQTPSDDFAYGGMVYAQGDGKGQKMGLSVSAGGALGTKIGLQLSAHTPGDDYAYGGVVSAFGDGKGPKVGLHVVASGALGVKAGVDVYASTPGADEARAVSANASSAGTGVAYGIVARASGTGTGTKFGVYASASGSGTLWAGYFDGPVYVRGALTKAGGGFLIDHPLDPDNRTLRHDFVESPEALCLYRGRVELDEHGRGTVAMPSYFTALTDEANATVHLTAVTTEPFAAGYEWNETGDQLTVVGRAGARVDYLVLAERDDTAHRAMARSVEEDKGDGNVVGRGVLLLSEPSEAQSEPRGVRGRAGVVDTPVERGFGMPPGVEPPPEPSTPPAPPEPPVVEQPAPPQDAPPTALPTGPPDPPAAMKPTERRRTKES